MDPRPTPRRLSDRGISSVQFVLASGLAMLLFLALANLIVFQYGRGAVRSALDQGARVGAISSSAARCEQRIDEVLGQLLGGRMGDGVTTQCQVGPGTVTATGSATFPSWTPFGADLTFELVAVATREVVP